MCPQRGKFRPRLVQLAQSNDNTLTKSTTLQASPASHIPLDAVKLLSTLSGIGPATASAILSVFHPSTEPFMSDEAIECMGIHKPEYTLKGWQEYRKRMQERVKKSKWDGMAELEMACYSYVVQRKFGDVQPAGEDEGTKKHETAINKDTTKRSKRKSVTKHATDEDTTDDEVQAKPKRTRSGR